MLDVTGKVAVYSTGPVERRCAKRQMPITLVPAEECWTGTVPAVVPIPGRYWPSITMFTEFTKIGRKENFDTNLDPDPEWLLICDMCSNTK